MKQKCHTTQNLLSASSFCVILDLRYMKQILEKYVYEWEWGYLQSAACDVGQIKTSGVKQALYKGTNQPFNAKTLAQTPFVPSDHEHTQTVQSRARNRELVKTMNDLYNDWGKLQTRCHQDIESKPEKALVSYNVCKQVIILSSHWPVLH